MARQGGRVQLEQTDVRLGLKMAKMAKEGFLRAAVEETQYLIKKPRAEVREEKERGVELAGHEKVKAAIERHPAMLRRNHMPGCPPCQNGTAKKSADTLETERHTSTSAQPTQTANSTADSRGDCTADATSAQNTTHLDR